MSTQPVSPGGNFSSSSNRAIDQVIESANLQLGKLTFGIKAEELLTDGKPDRDHNHKLQIHTKDGWEKISLFALNLNGNPKKPSEATKELVSKVKAHLENKLKTGALLLDSGALLLSGLKEVKLENNKGYFAINGKKVVLQREKKYVPLPTAVMQSYTYIAAHLEKDLLIVPDDHEKLRDDGKEGFIFNLKKLVSIKKTDLQSIGKDFSVDAFPGTAEYYILYRKREDAL